MKKEEKKEKKVLPNPDVPREQCVKECIGCDKMFSSMEKENGERDVIGDVCMTYPNPKIKWKDYRVESEMKKIKGKETKVYYHYNPCPVATHVTHSPKKVEQKGRRGWKRQK